MRAAVLVPLYTDADGDVRVVFTKRPDHMASHAGDVVFPGGTIDEHDGSPVATALREAREEVGIPEEAVEVIGGLEPRAPGNPEMIIVPVVAQLERPADLVPAPAEVEVIIEPRLEDLLDEELWRREDFHGRELWFYEFPEGTLWGATAFMVRELLGYLR